MKKLLLTLLGIVCSIGMSWGADATLTYKQPTSTLNLLDANLATTLSGINWQYRGGGTDGKGGAPVHGYYLDSDYLVLPINALARTNVTWRTEENGAGNSNGATWDATTPFKGNQYYFGESGSTNNCTKLSQTRLVTVKVTNCTGAKIYGASNMKIVAYDATNDDGTTAFNNLTEDKNATIASNASTAEITELDKSKTYILLVYSSSTSNTNGFEVALKRAKLSVTSTTLDGVKLGGATLDESTDYSIEGTTITLNDAYGLAPSISLVKKITYDDNSTETKDVPVTLNKNAAGTYFEGTATIGSTEYTVKVPVNSSVGLEADKTSISLSPYKVYRTKTSDITITGANLTGNVTIALASEVEGLSLSKTSITPTAGAVNEAVTVTYTAAGDVTEGNVNLTISSPGATDVVIPVTYSATAPLAQTTVSEKTTWDWATLATKSGKTEIKYTDVTTPTKTDVFVAANEDAIASVAASDFNAQALEVKGEYLIRQAGGYTFFQGPNVNFKVTKAGTIKVKFSDTGNRADETYDRVLYVNGQATTYKTHSSTPTESGKISVEAGDVKLNAYYAEPASRDNNTAEQYLRYLSIVYTPTATLSKITVNGKDYTEATENTFTISDQTFTKNPTVTYTDSNGDVASVTMTYQNDGTSKGTFTLEGTEYTVIAQNYTKVQTSVIATLQGGSSSTGTFSSETWGTNVAKSWTSADEKYTIEVASGSGRFSSGWWGSPSVYGFCVNNTTMTINVPANVKIEGVEVLGQGYYNAGTVTADADKFIIPTKNTFGKQAVPVEPVMLIVKNPVAGQSLTFKVSEHNCYIKLYGTEVTSENITTNANGVASYVTTCPLDFTSVSDLTAYVCTATSSQTVTLAKATVVPAGAAIVVKATDKAVTSHEIPTTASATPEGYVNLFKSGAYTVQSTDNVYCLNTVGQFQKVAAGVTVPAGKAYLKTDAALSKTVSIFDFDDVTTAITFAEATEKAQNTAVKAIVNGKLVIIRDGKAYNAAGAQIK